MFPKAREDLYMFAKAMEDLYLFPKVREDLYTALFLRAAQQVWGICGTKNNQENYGGDMWTFG